MRLVVYIAQASTILTRMMMTGYLQKVIKLCDPLIICMWVIQCQLTQFSDFSQSISWICLNIKHAWYVVLPNFRAVLQTVFIHKMLKHTCKGTFASLLKLHQTQEFQWGKTAIFTMLDMTQVMISWSFLAFYLSFFLYIWLTCDHCSSKGTGCPPSFFFWERPTFLQKHIEISEMV